MSGTDSGQDAADAGRDGLAPLIGDLRQLGGEARAYVEAELALQSARAVVLGTGLRRMALFGTAAFVFGVFALVALTVGLLIALTPLVTAWGATAIVAGALALAAAVSLRAGIRAWQRMRAALTGEPGDGSEDARP